MSSLRPWASNLALLTIASIAALLLAEVLLRAGGISFPDFYKTDTHTGVALRPGAAGWYTYEGRSFVQINRDGLRDREHAKAKPNGTFRIAVLGDSYAEALQIPQEDAFWAVMERDLVSCPALAGRVPEAINFGVSGYGTAQELLMLRHRVWQYEPDVVVLAFLTGNDLRNNVRELEQDPLRPYFVVRDGALVLDGSFLTSDAYLHTQSWLWRAKTHVVHVSRVAQLLYEIRRMLKRHELATVQQAELDNQVYREPADPRWQEAWDVTERMLVAMRDEVRDHGAEFLLVTLTNNAQVHPDPAVRQDFASRNGIHDLRYPDRRLAAFAESEAIPILTLVGPFADRAQADGMCLHGFDNAVRCGGHWNARGHHLAGELIAQRLCSRLSERAQSAVP